MKKKLLICGVLLCASLGLFSGCGQQTAKNDDSLKIVSTIAPVEEWVEAVIGDDTTVETTLLLDEGMDLHSFQPSADDIITISNADLFVYVGGETDAWVDDVLEQANNDDMMVLNLMEVLGDRILPTPILDGATCSHDHDHDHDCHDHDHDSHDHDHDCHDHDHDDDHDHDHDDHDHDHDCHDHAHEYDEHIWLSLKNAAIATQAIADVLSTKNPNANYQANAQAYIAELTTLDQAYADTLGAATYKTMVFGDRFPFVYLMNDYGLSYYAAFNGCSTETEASFETITFLAKKLDETHLPAVITLEGSDQKIAQTIVENTTTKDQKIYTLNSFQSLSSEEIKDDFSYLEIMKSNLEVFKSALQ